eukprot:5132543-Amphidinium_carterae.1
MERKMLVYDGPLTKEEYKLWFLCELDAILTGGGNHLLDFSSFPRLRARVCSFAVVRVLHGLPINLVLENSLVDIFAKGSWHVTADERSEFKVSRIEVTGLVVVQR